MREIDVGEIIKAIEELCIKANKILPDDLCGCISCAEKSETDELPKKIMGTLLENLDATCISVSNSAAAVYSRSAAPKSPSHSSARPRSMWISGTNWPGWSAS